MMNIEIFNNNLRLDLHGFSGKALNKDYAGTAFSLMNRMWQIVKAAGLNNKGVNIWVYEPADAVFAGVELEEVPQQVLELEHKVINIERYAYFKHIGSYRLLKQSGQAMKDELTARGYMPISPYIEIYGHWTNDETKLQTELIIGLR